MPVLALGAPDVVPVVITKVFVAVDALGVLEGHLLLLLARNLLSRTSYNVHVATYVVQDAVGLAEQKI